MCQFWNEISGTYSNVYSTDLVFYVWSYIFFLLSFVYFFLISQTFI
jgi:hypothetical protein